MISGVELKKGFSIALKLLENEKEHINAINVYPVADGDTGTNMFLTLRDAMSKVNGFSQACKVMEEIAEGMLESAKGNSGVILSQFMWGFRESIEGKEFLSNRDLAKAFVNGAKMAYMAVDNPVEGTILTVMRAVAEEASLKVDLPQEQFFEAIFERAVEELNKTPEMLAKLGKPKVVDSGAYGFVLLLEGLMRAVGGKAEFRRIKTEKDYREKGESGLYCSNFLLELNKSIERQSLRKDLRSFGNSIVVVGTKDFFKIHIHTKEPEKVKEYLARFGNIKSERIEVI